MDETQKYAEQNIMQSHECILYDSTYMEHQKRQKLISNGKENQCLSGAGGGRRGLTTKGAQGKSRVMKMF